MLLSTFDLNPHKFIFVSPIKSHTNKDIVFTYIPQTIPLLTNIWLCSLSTIETLHSIWVFSWSCFQIKRILQNLSFLLAVLPYLIMSCFQVQVTCYMFISIWYLLNFLYVDADLVCSCVPFCWSMTGIADINDKWAAYAGPGGWNGINFVFGRQYWFIYPFVFYKHLQFSF